MDINEVQKHIDWLKQKMVEALKELRTTHDRAEAIVEEATKAHRIYELYRDTLHQAMTEAGIEIVEEEEKSITIPKRTGPSIPDLAEEAIIEYGPFSSKELQLILEEKGKKTTVNAITVSLNRYRPHRFDRNGEGKWYLVTQEGSGSEEIQAASK